MLGNRDDLLMICIATRNVYNTPGLSVDALCAIELAEVALHMRFDYIKQSIYRH